MTRQLQIFLRARSWLVLAAGFACFPFGSALAEDIKIGVLEPFTGPWAKNGNESYMAMEIARDMINEKGGIRGDKIAFIRGDAPDPSAGKSEAERRSRRPILLPSGAINTFFRSDRLRAVTARPRSI